MELFNISDLKSGSDLAEVLYFIGNKIQKKKTRFGNSDQDNHGLEQDAQTLKRALDTHIEFLVKEFSEYGLNGDDIMIISFLWSGYFGMGQIDISTADILTSCPLQNNSRFSIFNRIDALVKKSFIHVSRKDISSLRYERRFPAKMDITKLENISFRIHPQFIGYVIEKKPFIQENDTNVPFKDNQEYLKAWMQYHDTLAKFSSGRLDESDKDAQMQTISEILEDIENREKITEEKPFPLRELINEFKLDSNEQIFIVHLLIDHIENKQSDIDELMGLISEDSFERMKNLKYFKPEGKLKKHKIIHVTNDKSFLDQNDTVTLQIAVTLKILGEEIHSDQERLKNLIAGSDLFTYRTPQRGMNDIVLSPEIKHNIETAIQRYNTDTYSTLESWGIYAKRKNEGEKYLPKLVMLFYGLAGTGKTLVSEVIAKELQKDLLITDCSKVMSAWVGESQKNTSQIFQKYNELVDRLDNPPILLLNEADQLLSKRTEGNGTSVDKMYHQMQNILLEGIENFRGILILTTNMADSMDQAFSRRFDLKIEFKQPDEFQRKSLWDLLLNPNIPGVDEVDSSVLAKEFTFTGGQIAVIIENSATEAASMSEHERKLTTELLRKYCKMELNGQFEKSGNRKIGF